VKNLIKASLVALALTTGSSLASCVVGPAGGVAFGYRDGYWDRDHHWHAWANAEEANQFRTANGGHYYDRPHDAETNGGWHDDDRYWEHH